MKSNRPNIVLIMSDEHNSTIMGCAGNSTIQTPALDALAGQGTRFTNTYCPFPLCGPSRAGFLTAQYPSQLGIFDGEELSSFVPTFAHSLSRAGYHTALCGRMGWWWGPDQFHGFRERPHGDCIPVRNVLTPELLGSGFNKTSGQTRYAVEVSGYGRQGNQLFDQSVTDSACSFITARASSPQPYCLVVGLMLPHCPLICSRDLFEYYMERIDPPQPMSREYLDNLHPAMKNWRERRGMDELTPVQNQRGLAAYYGLVTELDGNVGKIVEAIENSPQADQTAIVYTSDHGDMACEHGMWWKSNFYDGSSRAPLVISYPGRFPEGATEDSLASLIDVGPTLLDMVGAEPLPDVEGRSLLGFLEGGAEVADWPNEVYCEYSGLRGDHVSYMIRSGRWKLNYYHEFRSCQLFDMEEDPEEMHDRAGDPSCKEVVDSLLARIEERWDAEEYKAAAEKLARQRLMLRVGSPYVIPHPVNHFSAPAGYNQFDYSQLPQPPRPRN